MQILHSITTIFHLKDTCGHSKRSTMHLRYVKPSGGFKDIQIISLCNVINQICGETLMACFNAGNLENEQVASRIRRKRLNSRNSSCEKALGIKKSQSFKTQRYARKACHLYTSKIS